VNETETDVADREIRLPDKLAAAARHQNPVGVRCGMAATAPVDIMHAVRQEARKGFTATTS
jgi:hypothetical protein